MERVIAGVTLFISFLVMASIFVPESSHAGDEGSHGAVNGHARDGDRHSTDPHAGLLSLGSVEEDCYAVHIYATSRGPRYSVYDMTNGEELGVLLSAEKVSEYFPDLPLPELDFSANTQLMLVDPTVDDWR